MIRVLSLSTMAVRCHRLTPGSIKGGYSEFFRIWQVEKTPASKKYLYPPPCEPRLPLKAFRGEPAISGFGKLFTPTHRSSQRLAIRYGSDLHSAFAELHPAHG